MTGWLKKSDSNNTCSCLKSSALRKKDGGYSAFPLDSHMPPHKLSPHWEQLKKDTRGKKLHVYKPESCLLCGIWQQSHFEEPETIEIKSWG